MCFQFCDGTTCHALYVNVNACIIIIISMGIDNRLFFIDNIIVFMYATNGLLAFRKTKINEYELNKQT